MGSGESEEENWAAPSIAGAKLTDYPVLFFVVTRRAFREEIASIHHVATEAAGGGDVRREHLVDLGRRLEFLERVCSYHTVAEDEVIFKALDAKVKNVMPTYSFEHSSVDVNFSSIFDHLDVLMKKDEDTPEMFQALISSISTMQAMTCHHMHKEEEQVFPLLMEKLTAEEQSQLVWQYMCSVPVMILEEFLPWMILHLTSDEKIDVLNCITLIIPKESLLQKVVISWIQNEKISSDDFIYGKGYQLLNGLLCSKDIHKLFHLQFNEPCSVQTNDVKVFSKGVYFWHAAMRRDLYQIIAELYQIRSSNSFSSLPPVIVQLKFIADILVFYSNSLDKFINPLLNLISKKSPSPLGPLIDECHIKGLQRILFYEHQVSVQLRNFVEMLCQELESLVRGLEKNLMFLETEVSVSISKSCTREMQLCLLYTLLHMMPLGLLKCTVTWFSAHLTDNQSNSLLKNIKLGCPAVSNSFTSILYEWVHMGCSEPGKITIDRFRHNLEEMFSGRSFYLGKQNRQPVMSAQVIESNLTTKTNKSLATPSSSVSRPMDLIFYIHRGLLKDVEYLASLSAKLSENLEFISDFKKCFKLLCIIYQIHSTLEDEIAFPTLESKRALIDHKLEDVYFSKTSKILEEICEFHDHEGISETVCKLCLKLHETCMSMHKVLKDHIHREEVEFFPLVIGSFSTEEEEKIVGHMLGGTGAENLQKMIAWLMAYLTSAEKNLVLSSWLRIARYTKFDEWLREWWEDLTEYNVSLLLGLKDHTQNPRVGDEEMTQKEFSVDDFKHSGFSSFDKESTGGYDVEIPGQCPSYRDELELTLGCKHYKRNCKLIAPCCNKLFTCIRCHDELTTDHSVDRKAITKMMCMKCLVIQPIGPECMSQSCCGFSMGKYYCRICKLFDDEREIYHCPYCNLCRVGKGLGVDYFHSMEYNFCISRSLYERVHREKYPETNCPICHEYMFTLNSQVRGLPCGHFMHSSCFQDYTCSEYICPICSKSLGDMKLYFGMLDELLLAEDIIPEEYSGQVQVIKCNDCEERGTASFHWLYHKCSHCASYNTRLLWQNPLSNL